MTDQLTKIEAKIQKQLEKAHRTKFKAVRKKIRKLKLRKEHKLDLIYDLVWSNGDLLDVLFESDQFESRADYIDTINSYLELEYQAYEYPVKYVYEVGTMQQIMRVITLKHRVMDILDNLESQLFKNANQ